ncbi:hypothetical protein BsWGS_20529 [Bradybaena similaris]
MCALSLTAAGRTEEGEVECGNAESWTKYRSDQENKDIREVERIFTFSKQFCRPPKIHLSVTYLDAAWNKNVRYEARLASVNETHVRINCRTWDDSEINNMRISFVAISD